MYILVKESDIKSKAVREKYHERVPDGRVILTPQELKTVGSIKDCQIVQTARELKEMMAAPVQTPADTGVADTDGGSDSPDYGGAGNGLDNAEATDGINGQED